LVWPQVALEITSDVEDKQAVAVISREDSLGPLIAEAEVRSAVNRRVELGEAPSEEIFC
jgi:hypothetical protein